MADDFENTRDIENLSDDELRRLVRDELAANVLLDEEDITVTARDGHVTLSGRVGTEAQRRVAEHVLTDILGLTRFTDDLSVDPMRRSLMPEAADEEVALSSTGLEGELLGDEPDSVMGDTAEHLVEDLDARLYGTHDLQSSIERGTPWVPPETPTPEGFGGDDPDVPHSAEGERH